MQHLNCSDLINLILYLPSLNQQIAMWLNNQTDLYTYLHMGIGSDAVLYDILVGFNSGMVRQALIDANGYTAIYTWYYLNNPQQVLQYGAKHAHGLVSTWQTAQAPHSMAAYFGFVQQYFGQTAYDFMLQLYQSASKTYLDSFNLSEWHIYGSARLGIYQTYLNLVTAKFNANTGSGGTFTEVGYGSAVFASVNYQLFSLQRGEKVYELTNHLGNVLLTVSDKRQPQCSATAVTGHTAYVISATDYSAFGAPLDGRTWNAEGYRFSFGGHEKDFEIVQGWYGFGDYGYDSRIMQRPAPEPLIQKYPYLSPYVVFGNNPIVYSDPDGLDRIVGYTILTDRGVATFDVVTKNEVMLTYIEKSDNMGNSGAGKITFTDINQFIILDFRTNLKPGENRTFTSNEFSGKELGLIQGSQQLFTAIENPKIPGGIMFTAGDGGPSPTKTRSESSHEIINIETLLLYAGTTHFGKLKLTRLKDDELFVPELVQRLTDAYKLTLNPSKTANEKLSWKCTNKDCNLVTDDSAKTMKENSIHSFKKLKNEN